MFTHTRRFIRRIVTLFRVSQVDGITVAAATRTVPLRRALRIEPTEALRVT